MASRVDGLSRFYTAHLCAKHTHTHTHRQTILRTTSVATATSMHCVHVMWPKNWDLKIHHPSARGRLVCQASNQGWALITTGAVPGYGKGFGGQIILQ